MPALRRTTTRRTSNATEPAKDTTKTKVVIPDDTEAEITEQIGAKLVTYKGKVKEDETPDFDIEDDLEESEDFNNDVSNFGFTPNKKQNEEIPKDKLDLFFDDLDDQEFYFIKITRIPDHFTDKFLFPCNSEMPLGAFQFSLSDRFNFIKLLQMQNNNSGGRFNILAFNDEQKPVLIPNGWLNFNRREMDYRQAGIKNLLVANPIVENKPESNASSGIENVLLELGKMQQNSTQTILQAIQELNKPKEPSILEKALEQKMIKDLTDDKPKSESFEEKMLTIFAMPQMVEKMANKMFPEKIENPQVEPSTLDKILSNELVVSKGLDLVSGLSNMAGQIAAAKIMSNATVPNNAATVPNPTITNPNQPELNTTLTPEQIQQNELQEQQNIANMQNIINDIVTELETDNPLNAENETLINLQASYPAVLPQIIGLCKMLEFTQVVEMLENFVPDTFAEFKDSKGKLTKQGEKIINVRLKEFYEYVKTQN